MQALVVTKLSFPGAAGSSRSAKVNPLLLSYLLLLVFPLLVVERFVCVDSTVMCSYSCWCGPVLLHFAGVVFLGHVA